MKTIIVEFLPEEARIVHKALHQEAKVWDKLIKTDIGGETKETGIGVMNTIEDAKRKIEKALGVPKETK